MTETPDQRKKRLITKKQANYRKRQRTNPRADINPICMQNSDGIDRHELGRMDQICINCGAKFWMEERD